MPRFVALALTAVSLLFAGRVASGTEAAPPDESPGTDQYWRAMAQFRLSSVSSEEANATARSLLTESARLGFAPAEVVLGTSLLGELNGFTRNAEQGLEWLRKAAERGDSFARVALAEQLIAGSVMGRDLDLAESWLRQAIAPEAAFFSPTPPVWFWSQEANGGARDAGVAGGLEFDPEGRTRAFARYLLGKIEQERGRHGAAHEHFLAAANAGRAGRSGVMEAAVQAAYNCAYGRGVDRDRRKAIALLEQARELLRRQGAQHVHGLAAQGAIESFAVADLEESLVEAGLQAMAAIQFEIAEHFADAKSGALDMAEAAAWYELAAEHDHGGAMVALGLISSRGPAGPPDRVRAFGWFEKAGDGPRPKSLHGAACLAICHARGLGTPADPKKAAAIFSRWRNDDFVCHLGTIKKAPADVLSEVEATALLEKWVEKKNVHAQFIQAKRLLFGWGCEADPVKGRKSLQQAADRGSGAACGLLGELFEYSDRDYQEAAKYYERGRRKKDPGSAVALARKELEYLGSGSLMLGEGVSPAYVQLCVEALKFDPDFVAAHELLIAGYMKPSLRSVGGAAGFVEEPANIKRAREHARRAYDLGSAGAAHWLGVFALHGIGEPEDPGKAYRLFLEAVERGSVDAHMLIGDMHEKGLGVPVTPEEAAYHYSQAAIAGHPGAARALATMYRGGRGLPEDLDRAGFWLSMLARGGERLAMYELATIRLGQERHAEAVELLEKVVLDGSDILSAKAHVTLARCYRLGLGVEASPQSAKDHLWKAEHTDIVVRKLASANEAFAAKETAGAIANFEAIAEVRPEASYALGQIYYFGQGVAVDREAAVRYLRLAAERDHADALYFLAGMTGNRVDGAPPLEEAIGFARRAVELERESADKLLRKLEKRRESESD